MSTIDTTAVEGIENRWKLFTDVPTIIDEKFEDGRGYAQDAFRIAQETIERLSTLASSLAAIDVNVVSTLEDVTAPTLDTFTTTAPTSPSVTLNMPDDIDEADDLGDALHDKILSDIQSGEPAISEEVEEAIFKRGSERDELLHKDELDSISAEWAKRGFTLPNGMLASNIAQAVINHFNKQKDLSRDISIKNFELSDTNTKFVIEKGIQWLLSRIEIYKAKVQGEIARIDAVVKKYLGEVEVYKGAAEVYTSLTNVQIKRFDGELRLALGKAELVIKDAEIDMKNYETLNKLKIGAMDAISGVSAQLVAGALSSVSAGVHMSAQNASSYTYSTNPSY